MLSHAELPKSFWGEAVKTVVDIINLSPSVPLDGAIPEEICLERRCHTTT